jgi:hypothetical protein
MGLKNPPENGSVPKNWFRKPSSSNPHDTSPESSVLQTQLKNNQKMKWEELSTRVTARTQGQQGHERHDNIYPPPLPNPG